MSIRGKLDLERVLRNIKNNDLYDMIDNISYASKYGCYVMMQGYPIKIEIWDDIIVFSIHFKDNIKKISEKLGKSIEDVYYLLSEIRTTYSFSFDEDYNFYFSSAMDSNISKEDVECAIYDLFEAGCTFDEEMWIWKKQFGVC